MGLVRETGRYGQQHMECVNTQNAPGRSEDSSIPHRTPQRYETPEEDAPKIIHYVHQEALDLTEDSSSQHVSPD